MTKQTPTVVSEAAGTDSPPSARTIIWLLGAVLALLASAELVSRFVVPRISRIERRTEDEYNAVLASRGAGGPRRKVLVLGNSLLLHGVDFPNLRQALLPESSVLRWAVEQTTYLDWYYALRRFAGEGVRADVVVLFLDAGQMAQTQIRGDYFGYRMLATRDWIPAARDAGLPATQAFSLLLGRLSAYYGLRAETRKAVLTAVLPGAASLAGSLVPGGAAELDHDRTVNLAAQRLQQCSGLVRRSGGRLIVVAPASVDPRETLYLREAGALAGVTVLVPLSAESVSSGEFRDLRSHMNPRGAARYTAALIPLLRSAIVNELQR